MKTTIKIETEIEAVTVLVKAGVRYWEDATVNGVEDENGDLIPCREGALWCPIINIDTGIITNWKQGTTADIHYKICDAGSYYVQDADGKTILSIEDDYVPNSLIPGQYGDYIIMKVDEYGNIENWNTPTFEDFESED
jgi:hypothetical protein